MRWCATWARGFETPATPCERDTIAKTAKLANIELNGLGCGANGSWRYRVGVSSATQATMSLRMMPLTRYVPPDQFWIFDVHRVSLGREIYLSALICANVGHAAYGLFAICPAQGFFA